MATSRKLAIFGAPSHGRQTAVTAAERMKVLRQRARDGRAVIQIEIDLEPVTEYLIGAELLQLEQIEDRTAVGAAIENLLSLLIGAQHLRRDA